MTKNTTQNWFDMILDSQKKIVDSVSENTKKWNKDEKINQVLDTSSENFNKWLDFQKDMMTKATTATSTGAINPEESKEFMNKWSAFYTDLFKSQVESINKTYKQNLEGFTHSFPGMSANNPWANMMGNNGMNSWNNAYTEMYKNMFSNFQGAGSNKEVFEGLFNHTQSFMKFYELWSPVMKAMENNSFDAKNLQSYFSVDAYKNFMDSFLHMMPADMKSKLEAGMESYKENMKKFGMEGMDMYKNFSGEWNNMTNQGNNAFSEAMNMYTDMYKQVQSAMAPFSKLITPNKYTKSAEEMMELVDLMNRYQITNAQMKFMTYNTGIKAMENMALELAKRTEKGETFTDMQVLFKMWLDTSDKFLVEFYETPEFSKLQAENSSITLKIKKSMDSQIEQLFSHLPLINRTEMDELYQTVYELNKKVKTLEKQLKDSGETQKTTVETPKSTVEKTTTTKPVAPTNKKK